MDAVKDCAPTVAPRVALALACPVEFVVAEAVMVDPAPLPPPTAKVTVIPETGFPFTSFTFTTSGLERAVLLIAPWLLPLAIEITLVAGLLVAVMIPVMACAD